MSLTSHVVQTSTAHQLLLLPQKDALVQAFAGKKLTELRTPAMVIDRGVFAANCARMHEKAQAWGAGFRAHIKTHKTAEGVRLQMASPGDDKIVVSTLQEAWGVVNAGLVKDGTVKDILYGLPVPVNKIADLSHLWEEMAGHGGVIRLLVDHPAQIQALEMFEKARLEGDRRRWSVFIKVDGGQKRAGVVPGSPQFSDLLKLVFASPFVSVFGFYCHAGNAYASKSLPQAEAFLNSEVQCVNDAAEAALQYRKDGEPPFVLAVGSTPTAHSASEEAKDRLISSLHGTLELHAGNYPMLDSQQLATGIISSEQIAQKVIATVVSYYPGRGEDGTDEALCDAGALVMSKDTGPTPGFGFIKNKAAWKLGRVSQEHGTLITSEHGANLEVGEMVEIVGQHACLIAAAQPWYYIVEGGSEVVDVWVPWKGW